MLNTLHAWNKLDGTELMEDVCGGSWSRIQWREFVKNAENTLEQLLCAFSDTLDQLSPICFSIF